MRAGILTISDSCSSGVREDESGHKIKEILKMNGWEIAIQEILPDQREVISSKLREWSDRMQVDLIITTGGTGFSPRDVTPEATLDAIDRRTTGLAEAIRHEGMKNTINACLSRAEAGLRGRTLIINLPGSSRAVQEGMEFLTKVLPHAMEMIAGKGH